MFRADAKKLGDNENWKKIVSRSEKNNHIKGPAIHLSFTLGKL